MFDNVDVIDNSSQGPIFGAHFFRSCTFAAKKEKINRASLTQSADLCCVGL